MGQRSNDCMGYCRESIRIGGLHWLRGSVRRAVPGLKAPNVVNCGSATRNDPQVKAVFKEQGTGMARALSLN